MDSSYMDRRGKNYWLLVIPAVLIIVAVAGVYFFVKSRQKLVSPIPPTPSFEVIFITPTPVELTPTASPSATPKAKKSAAETLKPTAKATASPSPKVIEVKTTVTATPTAKASATPSVKPTS